MKRFLSLGIASLLLVVLVACDKAAPAPPEAGKSADTTVRGGKEAPPRPNN